MAIDQLIEGKIGLAEVKLFVRIDAAVNNTADAFRDLCGIHRCVGDLTLDVLFFVRQEVILICMSGDIILAH